MNGTNIKQHDITDCGAACLASVASFYKLNIPISRIRQYASTDKKGTNILGMIEAAKKLGFDAKGVRGDQSSLLKIPKPSIAHIIVRDRLQHYVVIYKVSKNHVELMDPGSGKRSKSKMKDFLEKWTGVLVILLPNESFVSRNEKVSIFKRFWFLLKPHKYVLVQSLLGAFFYTLLGFSTSIYIQKITDHVLVNGDYKLLNMMSTIMISLLFIQLLLSVFKDIFLIRTGQEIDARLILGYYKHLLKLPQQFFDNMRVGEIISRINDAVKIRLFINNTSLSLTVNLLIVIFSFLIMFSYYWKLGLLMLCVIPLYTFIYILSNYLNKKTERKIMEASADLESQLVESLNSIKTIKQFGLEAHSHIKTETRFIKLLKIGFNSSLNQVFSNSSTQSVSNLFTILLLWSGSYYVIGQEITTGELLSFYAIIGYFTGPVSWLITSNKTIQNALIAADRLFEIMDLERESSYQKIHLNKENTGDLIFSNVSFRYGTRRDVFKGLDLRIKNGQITALVGESGSGKSTLMHLLQNLYPLQRGRILIGDYDMKYIHRDSLRSFLSIVPQKVDLFAGNIIENIAVGDTDANMEKVLDISKKLGLLTFIESLPDGYNTYLGENGASLSGGQKQRIAIARALYRDPEILILDEATASLDSIAENYVQKTILDLKTKGKTIILISHRLSSLVLTDHIIILEEGKVVEQGTHKNLLEKKESYYKLWNNQVNSSFEHINATHL